jgi:hypothetical protein
MRSDPHDSPYRRFISYNASYTNLPDYNYRQSHQ